MRRITEALLFLPLLLLSVPGDTAAGIPSSPSRLIRGDQPADHFGWSVASAGDVNGDGYADVIVGSPFYNVGQQYDIGRAYLYLGSPSGLSATPAWIGQGDRDVDEFGVSVAAAGDVNGDGYADVLIGAPGYDGAHGYDAGRVLLYLGSASGLSSSPAWAVEGFQPASGFGVSVGSAGDINGDGFIDVVVGSPYHKTYDSYGNVVTEGRVFIYFGSASGPAASPGWMTDGKGQFGYSVADAGDVNGDHIDDLIVGAHFYDAGYFATSNEGAAYVYLGSTTGPTQTPSWSAVSDQVGALFGTSVAGVGDVNGDGFADVVVGARLGSTRVTADAQSEEGRAFLYLGSAGGPSSSPAWSPFGDQYGEQFGFSVAGAGDVNGDGYADVVVGALDYTGGQYEEGRILLYLGSSGGLPPVPAWEAESDQPPAQLGFSVAGAGDVDGDGFSDIVSGADRYPSGSDLVGGALLYQGAPTENRPPTARAGPDARAECSSPAGATLRLDGSQSSDANSTPGTSDDIVSFDWFEDFGQPAQRFLGAGSVLAATLPLGSHFLTLRATDKAGASGTATVTVEVVDTLAPQISVMVTPAILWPPNHRLMDVRAVVSASDACGTPSIALASIAGNEPDDAPGLDDGSTVGDIRGAAAGTSPQAFILRAERADQGGGRVYTATYTSWDASGNVATAVALVTVPHDVQQVTEPLMIVPRNSDQGTIIEWAAVPAAQSYAAIRGNVAALKEMSENIDVGDVTCIASGLTAPTTLGHEDTVDPAAGEAFFYLVEYDDGGRSAYGTVSASKPRAPRAGGCP